MYDEFKSSADNLFAFKMRDFTSVIYFLLYEKEIVYIGMTKKGFFQRVDEHRKTKVFDEVRALQVEECFLRVFEEVLIYIFKPKYNTNPFVTSDLGIFLVKKVGSGVVRDFSFNQGGCTLEEINNDSKRNMEGKGKKSGKRIRH